MKDKLTPGRNKGRAKSARAAHRSRALRPRHVKGEVGTQEWAVSQNVAFVDAMFREHWARAGRVAFDPDIRPRCIYPAHAEPVGGASSLE